MFIRKKKNKSGSISVHVVSKETGSYKIIKVLGTSCDAQEIEQLVLRGKQFINAGNPAQPWLLPVKTSEELAVEEFIYNLKSSQIHTVGPELVFGTLFDRIGFNVIKDELFRHVTIARLAYPVSKLKTIDYLWRYQGREVLEGWQPWVGSG